MTRNHEKALFIILALAVVAVLFVQRPQLMKLPLGGCLSAPEDNASKTAENRIPKITMTVAILKEKILEQQKLVT